jgi:hypothetical protein
VGGESGAEEGIQKEYWGEHISSSKAGYKYK